MSRAARVISIDVLQRMVAALRVFEEEASKALTDLDMEVRRADQWVSEEQRDYWRNQVRRSEDKVAEARIALERARMFTTLQGERRSCVDEKKALDRAKRRLELSHEKVEAVRRWTHLLDREFLEYRGFLAQLASWLQVDLPRAVAVLKRMQLALERYVLMESSVEAPLPPPNLSAILEQALASEEHAATAPAETPAPAAAAPADAPQKAEGAA